MIPVYGAMGQVVFSVTEDEALEMRRSGDVVKQPKAGGGYTLQLTTRPTLPNWIGGTKYHFKEEVAPGVKVWALKPSGRCIDPPEPIAVKRSHHELEVAA